MTCSKRDVIVNNVDCNELLTLIDGVILKMENKKPRKVLNIRTPEQLHKKIYAIATIQGLSLNDAVNESIQDYVKKHEKVVLNLFSDKEAEVGRQE